MNLTEYAKHRGISKGMLSTYIKNGQLDGAFTKADRVYNIDPVKADAALAGNLHPSYRRQTGPRKKVPTPATSLNESRAKKEKYLAELNRLKVEERKGNLIPRDQVETEAFNAGRQVRDAMMGIPARVASSCAAETDQAVITEMLTKEIRLALEGLSA